ncbi:zinc metalloproteinase [Grosmannia clavigera kw1407]|uniref:Zinc metalloproteinase n=1 Tax=Grosmannia clavigera (strain kw1407 / UAMH 11150) TaxID=655863 RepID=F0X7G4_GROCL|nr:zinc metalloproteinase [Grosmannia clavigera kw1407]EFX06666.1 zinc metalloproteinase [Grosmannia clavigera kw1407]
MATEVATPRQQMLPAPDSPVTLYIRVAFAGETHVFDLPTDAVLDDLTIACEDRWDGQEDGAASVYDWSSHKYIGPPPVGLLKGAEDHDRPLAPLLGGTARKAVALRLVAPRTSAVHALQAAQESVRRREARRQEQRRHAVRAQTTVRGGSASSGSPYTFQQLQPLAHLPHADRSIRFLQRLRDDVGIRAAMQAHRFTVGLLTEMDPRQHTTASHEGTSRTLGLNRNQGQVIELRLRTDAGDGYRDYRTVRRTLCHELAHNVHGPHDGRFWALCHQIEREVESADYHASGRTLAGDDVDRLAAYQAPIRNVAEPGEEDEDLDHTDAGGWTGGSFVLGSGSAAAATTATATSPPTSTPPRRDLVARAAEDRLRRMAEQRRHDGSTDNNNSSNGSSGTNSSR